MHDAVHRFIQRVRDANPAAFQVESVLEVGSCDINGSPRQYFKGATDYVGVDWKEGPGVDIVSIAHKFKGRPDGYFQFVISTEMLEHDPHAQASIQRMMALLAPKGSLLITCAGIGRHSHDIETSPKGGYYANVSAAFLSATILSTGRFKSVLIEDDAVACDLRFFGLRKTRVS